MNTPNGLPEIVATFGNISQYIHSDGTLSLDWEIDQTGIVQLPFELTLAWDQQKQVDKIRCHKLLMPVFEQAFSELLQQGLAPLVSQFGGCYMYRPERASSKLSSHCWGIAIDLNPQTNEMGTDGDMDPRVIKILEDAGFHWGGNFSGKRKDPMHFQFCTGY
jgi:hypothetical protein